MLKRNIQNYSSTNEVFFNLKLFNLFGKYIFSPSLHVYISSIKFFFEYDFTKYLLLHFFH